MESESKLSQWMTSASDWLNDQEWFQQIRGKWEELDAQSRFYLKAAMAGLGVLLVLGFTLQFILGVRSLRQELEDKNELLAMIDTGNEELRRLRDSNSGMSDADGGPWNAYLETQAATAGLDKANITVSNEKGSDTSEFAKETRYDIELKKVNLKQLVQYAFTLENGTRPVKLRHMTVDTGEDPSGYLNATLSVSTFSLASNGK